MSSLQDSLVSFRELVKKIKSYEEAIALIYWDMRTGLPKKGVEGRSEVVGVLSAEMFHLATSKEMVEYLRILSIPENWDTLSDTNQKIAMEAQKEYDRNSKIPPEKYQAYVVLTSKAEAVWEEAKAKSDFTMFQPYLEQIVAFNLEFIELWGYKENKYDTLLEMYEPGMTVSKLDPLFQALRNKLVPLVVRLQKSPHQPETAFLRQNFAKQQQQQFSLFILQQMGYDFDAGRLDETVHPFATGLNPGDVRITTRYLPDDVVSALFGTIHEGGHALYEQNISNDLLGTNLCTGTSMGIHESQSRFWENMIGRSQAFWNRYYVDLQRIFQGQLDHVPVEDFYRAINRVEPSLIRIEADELTYNLHIMIRYEIEKALFNGTLQVGDLPRYWNDKYEEYLGIAPPNDQVGVLQDVHWAGGAFGYFPSYALGNLYAAQIRQTLLSQLPDFNNAVARGELLPIKKWLTEQIYVYGKSLTPSEIIVKVTGEQLNPNYLVDYLDEKYSEIYQIAKK